MNEFFASLSGPNRLPDPRLALGLLPPRLARRQVLPDQGELSDLLVEYWRKLGGRVWPWRWRDSTARLMRSVDDLNRLAHATDELLVQADKNWTDLGRGLRIELNISSQFNPLEVYGVLLGAGAHSVFFRHKHEGELAWSWPLRIGIATDSKLFANLSPQSSLRPLLETFNYERAPMRANLLLCETSLSGVTDAIKRIRHRPQTDGLIVMGGLGDTEVPLWQLLAQVSELTGAQGVFVFDRVPSNRIQTFAEDFVAHLCHDQPLDSAVARIVREIQIPVLSWATRSFVEATSVREQGRRMARRFEKMGDASIRLPRDAFLPAQPSRSIAPPAPPID